MILYKVKFQYKMFKFLIELIFNDLIQRFDFTYLQDFDFALPLYRIYKLKIVMNDKYKYDVNNSSINDLLYYTSIALVNIIIIVLKYYIFVKLYMLKMTVKTIF